MQDSFDSIKALENKNWSNYPCNELTNWDSITVQRYSLIQMMNLCYPTKPLIWWTCTLVLTNLPFITSQTDSIISATYQQIWTKQLHGNLYQTASPPYQAADWQIIQLAHSWTKGHSVLQLPYLTNSIHFDNTGFSCNFLSQLFFCIFNFIQHCIKTLDTNLHILSKQAILTDWLSV